MEVGIAKKNDAADLVKSWISKTATNTEDDGAQIIESRPLRLGVGSTFVPHTKTTNAVLNTLKRKQRKTEEEEEDKSKERKEVVNSDDEEDSKTLSISKVSSISTVQTHSIHRRRRRHKTLSQL